MARTVSTTTREIESLWQLYRDGQLRLRPEFQRNSVWPRAAKAYLIDTILTGNPVPVLYFQRSVSAQTGQIEYAVVDGQQRLSAIFDYLEDRFMLTESEESASWSRRRYSRLDESDKLKINRYPMVIQELNGYTSEGVRDIFNRMNRFVVALNPQERRHAASDGAFKQLVERVGQWDFWQEQRIISPTAAERMRADELAAELLILLVEGPQDKKQSVDLYYRSFVAEFPDADKLASSLEAYLAVFRRAVPDLSNSYLRRPANFYALVGAVHELDSDESGLPSPEIIGRRLINFGDELARDDVSDSRVSAFKDAQSRQTDNIRPRRTRIDILKDVIRGEI